MPTKFMVENQIKSTYDLINELKRQELFSKMIRNGLISVSFEMYHQIYERFLELSVVGGQKADIIFKTANEFNISERSVYVIINKMK